MAVFEMMVVSDDGAVLELVAAFVMVAVFESVAVFEIVAVLDIVAVLIFGGCIWNWWPD